jgi:hypothetical protein
MKNTLLNQRTVNLAFVVLAIVAAAVTAEAAPQPESMLLSAGFKAKPAQTVSQRQELETLAKGKISPVTQNGKTFYVYPDAARNQLYVGSEGDYQTYLDLITKAGGSARPIENTDYIGGNQVKVREFYGWEPFDQISR